jgi:hypothetical protein
VPRVKKSKRTAVASITPGSRAGIARRSGLCSVLGHYAHHVT